MKVRARSDLSNIKDLDTHIARTSEVMSDVVDALNGKVDFQSNIQNQMVNVNFTAINTDLAINHTLGYVPTGYMRHGGTNTGNLIDGKTPWTKTTIYLQATATGAVSVMIF